MAQKVAAFCEGKPAEIIDVKVEEKHYKPPFLPTLSSLQTTANQRFKYSPKMTLDIAQKLYVKGYISYPRTDSSFVTKGEASTFQAILKTLATKPEFAPFFPLPVTSLIGNLRYVNEKKVSDHYAIIPTEQIPNLDKLTIEEKNIYDLVVRALLAAHEEDAIICTTKVETKVDQRATFQSKGKVIKRVGWRKVIYPDKKAEKEDKFLPVLAVGEQGTVTKTKVKESVTQPPKRYTEGQLINVMKMAGKQISDSDLEKILMESQGLGTEATRAGIISILKDRGYMTVKRNIVAPTEKGRLLIEALGESVLTSAEMTAKWEQRLREIGKGEASSVTFMEQTKKLVEHLLQEAQTQGQSWDFSHFDTSSMQRKPKNGKRRSPAVGQCPSCGGAVLDRGTFYGCSQFKTNECRFTVSKTILKKKIRQKDVKLLLKDGQTEMIDGFVKGDQTFCAKLVWNKEEKKITFQY